ncbi:MAG: hypothetical protein WBV21_09870, partial [Desulfobacterales bacterium]
LIWSLPAPKTCFRMVVGEITIYGSKKIGWQFFEFRRTAVKTVKLWNIKIFQVFAPAVGREASASKM